MEKQSIIKELQQTIEQIILTQKGMSVHLKIIHHNYDELLNRIELIEKKINKLPGIRYNFDANTHLKIIE